MLFLCLWCISLHVIPSESICVVTDHKRFVLVYGWVIFHCVCVCFGHLMQRVDSLEKTLTLGGIGGRRRRGRQKMRWLDGITNSVNVGLLDSSNWWWKGRPGVLQFMGSQRVGHNWATELNWTDHVYSLTHHFFLTVRVIFTLILIFQIFQRSTQFLLLSCNCNFAVKWSVYIRIWLWVL